MRPTQSPATHRNREVVHPEHVQILRNLQILHLRLVPRHSPMVGVPRLDTFLPHLRCHLVLVDNPLGQQVLTDQHARLADRLVVVPVLGLDGVRREQDGSLRRTVHLHRQDRLLDLQEEHVLRDLLHQLLGHVLREELGHEHEHAALGVAQVDMLVEHLFVHLEPAFVALLVDVAQPKVPRLAQADRAADQIEQEATGGAVLRL